MSWQVYKGLEVPSAPTGDAGINLKEDLMLLADRSLSDSAVPGSVVFVGGTMGSPVLQDDVGMFCWDSTNNRLGIGTATPLEQVQIQGDGKALLMATGSTTGTSETFIYFGSGLLATGQWQRIRFRYGSGDLFFERKDSAGVWTQIMTLDWQKSYVGIGTDVPGTMLEVAGAVTLGPVQAGFANPPAGRAALYVESVGGVPTLRVKFENGIIKTLASGS